MGHDRNHLEQLEGGFVAFYTADGERWKHRDEETARTGPGYRLFVSDKGERRRYVFGPGQPHDTTVFDLREQVARATPIADSSVDEVRRAEGERHLGG